MFSDFIVSENDDDVYNTCTHESESDSDLDDGPVFKKPTVSGLVAGAVASYEASTSPTDIGGCRPRTGSTKRPGSPNLAKLDRRTKPKT